MHAYNVNVRCGHTLYAEARRGVSNVELLNYTSGRHLTGRRAEAEGTKEQGTTQRERVSGELTGPPQDTRCGAGWGTGDGLEHAGRRLSPGRGGAGRGSSALPCPALPGCGARSRGRSGCELPCLLHRQAGCDQHLRGGQGKVMACEIVWQAWKSWRSRITPGMLRICVNRRGRGRGTHSWWQLHELHSECGKL